MNRSQLACMCVFYDQIVAHPPQRDTPSAFYEEASCVIPLLSSVVVVRQIFLSGNPNVIFPPHQLLSWHFYYDPITAHPPQRDARPHSTKNYRVRRSSFFICRRRPTNISF
ncbi:hypothetical protein CDAR_589581 [Caerostris darwini]|uniref:Uncharacterized protein n=1 Tax=Caerostris darwini TaxID=1538125 RepID=A0AAV4NX84_9ARAC|nr:hypothetical protein CDAR_589581 [Caerostris darwini]